MDQYIINPTTGKRVKKDGKIGRQILKSQKNQHKHAEHQLSRLTNATNGKDVLENLELKHGHVKDKSHLQTKLNLIVMNKAWTLKYEFNIQRTEPGVDVILGEIKFKHDATVNDVLNIIQNMFEKIAYGVSSLKFQGTKTCIMKLTT